MSEDWQIGDTAWCIAIERDPNAVTGVLSVRIGGAYEVSWVGELSEGDSWVPALLFVGEPDDGHSAYDASNFRKIHPHQEDADDREVIALLTYAPARSPA